MKTYELEQFKQMVPMYVESVLDGLNRYPSEIMDGTKIDLPNFISSLTELAGFDESYADCYYYRIPEEAGKRLHTQYPASMLEVLERSGLSKEKYFIQLTPEILPVLMKLSMDEMLFSTFYFPTLGVMVWSNYEKQFPVFFESEEKKNMIMNKL